MLLHQASTLRIVGASRFIADTPLYPVTPSPAFLRRGAAVTHAYTVSESPRSPLNPVLLPYCFLVDSRHHILDSRIIFLDT